MAEGYSRNDRNQRRGSYDERSERRDEHGHERRDEHGHERHHGRDERAHSRSGHESGYSAQPGYDYRGSTGTRGQQPHYGGQGGQGQRDFGRQGYSGGGFGSSYGDQAHRDQGYGRMSDDESSRGLGQHHQGTGNPRFTTRGYGNPGYDNPGSASLQGYGTGEFRGHHDAGPDYGRQSSSGGGGQGYPYGGSSYGDLRSRGHDEQRGGQDWRGDSDWRRGTPEHGEWQGRRAWDDEGRSGSWSPEAGRSMQGSTQRGSWSSEGSRSTQGSAWTPDGGRSSFGAGYYSREPDRSTWNRDASGGFYGKGPKNYTRSDERIREDVCDRLSDDDEVDASDVTVTVRDGEVTLEGSVNDRRAKHRAEDIADGVRGVKDVHNRLSARKGMLQEIGDRLTGREETSHGHAGSGTKTTSGTSSTSSTGSSLSGSTVRNGI